MGCPGLLDRHAPFIARVNAPSPAGAPALDYFAATFPRLRAPQAGEAPADFLVDVTTRAAGNPRTEGAFAAAYAASQLRADNDRRVGELVAAMHARRLRAVTNVAPVGAATNPGSCGPCVCLPMPLRSCSTCGDGAAEAGSGRCGWCSSQAAGTVTPMWWGLLTLYRFRSLRAIKVGGQGAARLVLPRTLQPPLRLARGSTVERSSSQRLPESLWASHSWPPGSAPTSSCPAPATRCSSPFWWSPSTGDWGTAWSWRGWRQQRPPCSSGGAPAWHPRASCLELSPPAAGQHLVGIARFVSTAGVPQRSVPKLAQVGLNRQG